MMEKKIKVQTFISDIIFKKNQPKNGNKYINFKLILPKFRPESGDEKTTPHFFYRKSEICNLQ